MNINRLLSARRKELKLTMADVAKACGVSEATVSRWESGDIGNMKRSSIAALAKVLQISPSVIVGIQDETEYQSSGIDFARVPLYLPICCGNGGFDDDNIIDYVPVPTRGLNKSSVYFAQYAKGDSMRDAGISDGDLLIFEKTSAIDEGCIGCFCIDVNEAMCKKFKRLNGVVVLQPMNNNYDPIIIDPLNENFRCVGRLKKVIKNF